MKTNELMIGDLIHVYGQNGIIFSKPHWYVRKVTADWLVDMDTREAYDKKLKDRGFVVIPEQQLFIGTTRPIPLTEEILKANGFIIRRDAYYLSCGFLGNNCERSGVEVTFYNRAVIDIECNYSTHTNRICLVADHVHELQHALRLCELYEIADNFKLKENNNDK